MANNMANNLILVEVMKEEQGSLKDATYARALGVGKRQIYDWYAGRVLPTVRSARKVCNALKLDKATTSKVVNQLERLHEKRRESKRKAPQKGSKTAPKRPQMVRRVRTPEEGKEVSDLANRFINAGKARGITQRQLVEQTTGLNQSALYAYRRGELAINVRTRREMEKFIHDTAVDYLRVEAPKKHPKDYKLLVEQVDIIANFTGLSLEEKLQRIGVKAPYSFNNWRNGISNPVYENIIGMVDFIEDFNFGLPEDKQIDPFKLMPYMKPRKRITIEDYDLVHKIEHKYGALENCPDNEPMLLQLRKDWGLAV